jgi:hypothetical protein
VTVLPSSVTVCSNDPGVGFAMGPEEMMLQSCTPLPPIYGSHSVQIGDNDNVTKVSGGAGAVASAGTVLGVQIGNNAIVGDVLSAGPVTTLNRVQIQGLVEAAGNVQLGPQTTVTDDILRNTTPNLPAPPALPASFPPSQGNVEVHQGGTVSLAPGSYGDVDVDPRGTLNLVAGTYYMRSLSLELQTTAHLDTSAGPVFIYTQNLLNLQGAFVDPLHTKSNLFIGITGVSVLPIQVPFSGSLVAPSTQLLLGSPGHSITFTGEFFAKDIQVLPNTTIAGQSFTCP